MGGRSLSAIGRSGRRVGGRKGVIAKVHVVVGEIVLVVVGRLVTILSGTAALLSGTVFILAHEIAQGGNADNRVSSSDGCCVGASSELSLLIENVLLPFSRHLGNASSVVVARVGRIYIHDVDD